MKIVFFGHERTYQEGVEIYAKYSSDKKRLPFFKKVSEPPENSAHYSMLFEELSRIERIMKQNNIPFEEKINHAQIGVKKLTVKQSEFKISANDLLINVLKYKNWDELSDKEQNIFQNETILNYKKKLFAQNVEWNNKIIALRPYLDINVKIEESERAEIAKELIILKEQQIKNWALIDDLQFVIPTEQVEPEQEQIETEKTIAELKLELINIIRPAICKNKKKIEDKPNDKNVDKWKETLEKMIKREKEINAKIGFPE